MQEREYQELINNVVEVIVKADLDGNFTFLSQRWKEFTQYEPHESIGTSFRHYIYAEDLPLFERYFQQLVEDKIAAFKVDFRHLRKDGTCFWAQAQGRLEYDELNETPIGIAGTLQNIEEQKQTEIALREREQMLSIIVEKSRDVISIHDPDLTIRYISPAVEEITGYHPSEMVGKTTFDFIHPDFKLTITSESQQLQQGNQDIGGSYMFLHKNGEPRWVEALPKPVVDERGNVTAIIVSHRDVTHRILLEQELARVRKKLAMDFHDELGNHLTTISMLAKRIQLRIDPEDEEMKGLTGKIDQASKKVYDSTRDFIWTIDPEHDRLSLIFLYIRDFGVELFEYTSVQLDVQAELPKSDVLLPAGHSQHLILIFKEAMNNTLKHAQATLAVLSLEVEEDVCTIRLQDNGRGIDSGSEKSRGNGLINMQARAESIGGRVTIDSNQSDGTCVSLTLTLNHTS